jgi:hypothetical protein
MEASDSIITYYDVAKGVIDQGLVYMRYFNEYHDEAFNLVDFTLYQNPEAISYLKRPLMLLSTEPLEAKKTFNKLYVISFIIDSYIETLNNLDHAGQSTVSFLTKEYGVQ